MSGWDSDSDDDYDTNGGAGFTAVSYNHGTGEKDFFHFDSRSECPDPNNFLDKNSTWMVPPPSNPGYGRATVDVHGSSKGNGHPNAQGGYGVNWGPGHPNNTSQSLSGNRQTANRGYLEGATDAINQAKAQGYKSVQVESNSKYLADGGSKYMQQWKDQGWQKNDGGQLKNVDQWQRLDKAQQGINVKYDHKSGPSGSQQLSRGASRGDYK